MGQLSAANFANVLPPSAEYDISDTNTVSRCCQTNANQSPNGPRPPRSGRQLTPLGQRVRAVLLEDVAAIEVTMVVDRGMGGGEYLESLDVPEFGHGPLWPSKGLV